MAYKTVEETDSVISYYISKISEIEKKIPGIWLDIVDPRKDIEYCFTSDGKSLGDYIVLPPVKEKIIRLLSTPHFFYGKKLYGGERGFSLSIKAMAGFFTDGDLYNLSHNKSIKKVINGHEVEMVLSKNKGPIGIGAIEVVERFKKSVEDDDQSQITKFIEYQKLIENLIKLRKRLPRPTTITSDEDKKK